MKKILEAVVLLTIPLFSAAQSQVCLTPYVCDELRLPADARNSLEQKMLQMTTQNNFGSAAGEFILTVNPMVVDKQATATVPVQYIVDLEVSFYVVGMQEQVIVDETSVRVRGIGRTEGKAYIAAVNRINARTPALRQFMDSAREKIVDYYAGRVPVLLAKAQSQADRADYEGALATLAVVPESVPEYPTVAERMAGIYTQMVDKYATVSIQEAKSKIALRDYEGALDALLYVDPTSTRFDEAARMVDGIRNTIDAREQAELQARLERMEYQREMAQRAHDDEMMLRKMQIDASQKTAGAVLAVASDVAQGTLKDWLFGKLK